MKEDICKENSGLSTKNLKVIALDCDGVLFDSKEANIRFYSHIMEHIGGPPVRGDQHEYIHMYPVRDSLLYLTGGGDPTLTGHWSMSKQSILARLTATLPVNRDWLSF